MSLSKLIIIGVQGATLSHEEKIRIADAQPGGFILFGRNIKSPDQLRNLMDELTSLVKHPPIFCIDQEGGRVSRLREIGEEPPSAKDLRDKNDLALIEKHGDLTGHLLRLFGFNLDLCPVVDISFDDEADNSLKNRTWGKNPQEVILKARAFSKGLKKHQVLNCGKHFPGYSAAEVDPHHELPVVNRTRSQLENEEWLPYIEMKNELDTIMVGHALYPDLQSDSKTPSSLSKEIVQNILRQDLGYQGCIMTDDLDMGAIVNSYSLEDAVQLSVLAGNDLVLLCHRIEHLSAAANALEKIPSQFAKASLSRVENLLNHLPKALHFDRKLFTELNNEIFHLREAVLGAERAKERSPENGKRSPVEIY